MGSVFSPHYARARASRPGEADPLAHPAVNVALYGPRGDAWAFTEGTEATRTADAFALGRTSWRRRPGGLEVCFDEPRAPFGGRLTGRVRLEYQPITTGPVNLDRAGRHRWWPVAPVARAEVELEQPGLRFTGRAYHDANEGDRPLEDDFHRWSWWRLDTASGTRVGYDPVERRGPAGPLSVVFEEGGWRTDPSRFAEADLGRTFWGLQRPLRTPDKEPWTALRTLEDGPFYARTLLNSGGGFGVHEVVDLDRFDTGWVRLLAGMRLRRTR